MERGEIVLLLYCAIIVVKQRSTLHFWELRRVPFCKKLEFSMILSLIQGDALRFFN